jgi:hypothetical protein
MPEIVSLHLTTQFSGDHTAFQEVIYWLIA